ncbi:hypothetical protein [Lederbergia lenta]|uniref:hypothetical protein n=1 Tax=Lederbergia lenta TaxID=1467 RepID=UPI00203FCEAE|nr:hypothetical protein [Lederbergia lenta]MCM3109382.1 hypothetical protein [Lederbergia lenta]
MMDLNNVYGRPQGGNHGGHHSGPNHGLGGFGTPFIGGVLGGLTLGALASPGAGYAGYPYPTPYLYPVPITYPYPTYPYGGYPSY